MRPLDWQRDVGLRNPLDPFGTTSRDFGRILATKNVEDYPLFAFSYYCRQWPELCFAAVAENENDCAAIGYVLGHIEGKRSQQGHVMALAVATDHQGSGAGAVLMDALEGACAEQGVHFVDLYVRESNQTAISFYRRRGYSQHALVLRYYEDEDGLQMRKFLVQDSAYDGPPVSEPVYASLYDKHFPPAAQTAVRLMSGVGIGYVLLSALLLTMQ